MASTTASSAHPSDTRFDVCIRGAGIVGRSLALLLAAQRLRVALVHNAASLPIGHSDVRAYSLNLAAKQLLTDLRCWPEGAACTPVLKMHIEGDQGGGLDFEASQQGVEALNWMVDVPSLEKNLAAAVGYQPLIEERNEPVSAPLTVSCEGRASQTRAEWAIVWSLTPSRAQELLKLESEQFCQQLLAACQGIAGSIQLISERAVWPLQLARASQWTGRIAPASSAAPAQAFALAGDAAHAMHPLAGQGLNVGLSDAMELARVIQAKEFWRPLSDLKMLRRYERARQAEVLAMGFVTDGLQVLFAQAALPIQKIRNWGMSGFNQLLPLKNWMARKAMQSTINE